MRVFSSNALNWKGDWLYNKSRRLVRIVRDEKYPTMWRVQMPDGRLTDMVNRTRAKDAANSAALRILNDEETARLHS